MTPTRKLQAVWHCQEVQRSAGCPWRLTRLQEVRSIGACWMKKPLPVALAVRLRGWRTDGMVDDPWLLNYAGKDLELEQCM